MQGLNFADSERKRISGELHDNVSSKLAVLQYKLCRSSDCSKEVLNLLNNVMYTVRNLSHNLHTPFLDKLSLLNAIQDFVFPLNKVLDIKIESCIPENVLIPQNHKFQLFRIFQEIINNILKHANASQIRISLRYAKNHINLLVSDNGIGFNYNNCSTNFGMESIRFRAKKLNAKYKFKSIKGHGTLFIISVPLTNQ